VATVSNEVDEIRREMAGIRRDLHKDVKEVVETAGAVTDWRRYITTFPWVSLGAAFAAGYVLVPRRSRTAQVLADVSRIREAVEATGEKAVEATKPRQSLAGAALGMVVPLALRAAQGYAMNYLEQWILQQQKAHPRAGPPRDYSGHQGGPGAQGGIGPGRPAGPRRAGGPGPAS
jgi:hypothetical protein